MNTMNSLIWQQALNFMGHCSGHPPHTRTIRIWSFDEPPSFSYYAICQIVVVVVVDGA